MLVGDHIVTDHHRNTSGWYIQVYFVCVFFSYCVLSNLAIDKSLEIYLKFYARLLSDD